MKRLEKKSLKKVLFTWLICEYYNKKFVKVTFKIFIVNTKLIHDRLSYLVSLC